MACLDHDSKCCPAGDAHDMDYAQAQEHQVAAVINAVEPLIRADEQDRLSGSTVGEWMERIWVQATEAATAHAEAVAARLVEVICEQDRERRGRARRLGAAMTAMCCMCAGTCAHIGPHSYCWAHAPNGATPPDFGVTYTSTMSSYILGAHIPNPQPAPRGIARVRAMFWRHSLRRARRAVR